MPDTGKAFESWNGALAAMLTDTQQPAFPLQLLEALGALVSHHPPALGFVFHRHLPPVVFFGSPPAGPVSDSVESYLAGAYVLDPYYRAGLEGAASGFYRLKDLAPSGFHRSEYYRSYYARAGIHDELGYVVHVADGGFVNLSLGRYGPPRFPAAEVARLKAVTPVVLHLVTTHWGRAQGTAAALAGDDARARLEQVFTAFGGERLTPREQEVLRLMLRGHSVKSAARSLGIAIDTIKLHRKNIYAKLGVASQAALMARLVAELAGA